MATLREYFEKQDPTNLMMHEDWEFATDGVRVGTVRARLHFDFEARGIFISFFVPTMEDHVSVIGAALDRLPTLLEMHHKQLLISGGFPSEPFDLRDFVFTGQVYIYSEQIVPEHQIERLVGVGKDRNLRLTFRSDAYLQDRNRFLKPLAFISHDSRDKELIAKPLAIGLSKLLCPVWYDEFSLKVGDSLRESIEKGLKEARKCIVILTPNFLANEGWTKAEFNSIFTREIIETQKVILPIWCGVSKREVYDYSPSLADRVATNWDRGEDEVVRQIYVALQDQPK